MEGRGRAAPERIEVRDAGDAELACHRYLDDATREDRQQQTGCILARWLRFLLPVSQTVDNDDEPNARPEEVMGAARDTTTMERRPSENQNRFQIGDRVLKWGLPSTIERINNDGTFFVRDDSGGYHMNMRSNQVRKLYGPHVYKRPLEKDDEVEVDGKLGVVSYVHNTVDKIEVRFTDGTTNDFRLHEVALVNNGLATQQERLRQERQEREDRQERLQQERQERQERLERLQERPSAAGDTQPESDPQAHAEQPAGECAICLTGQPNMCFPCGHVCMYQINGCSTYVPMFNECAGLVDECPICQRLGDEIRLYFPEHDAMFRSGTM